MTLGLSMITNKPQAAYDFLLKYGDYFDKWFITIAAKDKKQYDELQDLANNLPKLHLSYFKWKDDFAAARNYNKQFIDTDYWFWADDDDTIQMPERLPEILKYMERNELDVVQLKYDYAQNEMGDATSDHWRERVIRTQYASKWDAPVHETLQSVVPARIERLDWMVIKHKKDAEASQASMHRNERILRKHWDKTKDPRDAHYLGNFAMAQKDYPQAVDWFLKHIAASGSDEDKYRSWCRIADCEWISKRYEQAIYATDEAVKLRPAFPDAYYIKVLVYTASEVYDKGIEWLKVAMDKPTPDTLAVVDPTLYKYRGMAMGAMCYLFSGRVREAYRLYQAVIAEAPDYYKRLNKLDGVNWPAMYESAYFDQKAIDYTRFLLHYLGANQGDPIKLLQSLSPRLLADVRLAPDRTKFLPKTTWPTQSIVFYCGPAGEQWGPDTLDKGMGGSEEAIVYLSRELVKLGWQVTVFNDREEEYFDEVPTLLEGSYSGVTYKPWTLLNPADTFDVFVSWRSPENLRNIKARKLVLDLHDAIQAERIYALKDNVQVMVKSKYHRNLYPDLPNKRFVIAGNAINEADFND